MNIKNGYNLNWQGGTIKQDPGKNAKGCVLLVIIAAIGCYFLFSGDSKEEKKTEDVSKLGISAFTISEQFIKEQLKAPATADFPGDTAGKVRYLGDSVYYIRSYVDAQNSFGANIRTNYAGKVKYKGKYNWINIDLALIER